jgi:hypothetical protein
LTKKIYVLILINEFVADKSSALGVCMDRLKKIPIILGMILLLCLTLPFPQAIAQTAASPTEVQGDRPFTSSERQAIVQKLLSRPGLQFRRTGDRVRELQVISDIDEKNARFRFRAKKRRAEVTLVNYSQGKAYRVLVDPTTGVIARQEQLPNEKRRKRLSIEIQNTPPYLPQEFW